jgi:hypothetical protein
MVSEIERRCSCLLETLIAHGVNFNKRGLYFEEGKRLVFHLTAENHGLSRRYSRKFSSVAGMVLI